MQVVSPAFDHRGELPDRFRYDEGEHGETPSGKNISPCLQFKDIPESAQSLALVVRDIDAPHEQLIHWLLWNIDADREEIPENERPSEAIAGKNSYAQTDYKGPNPAQGKNKIWFDAYALDTELGLDEDSDIDDFEAAIEDHIIDKARLVASCKRTGEFALE